MWPFKNKKKSEPVEIPPLPDIRAYREWEAVRDGMYHKGGTVMILTHQITVHELFQVLLIIYQRSDSTIFRVYMCPFISSDVRKMFVEVEKYLPGMVVVFKDIINDIPFQCYICPFNVDIFSEDNWSKKALITPAFNGQVFWPNMYSYNNPLVEILEGRGGWPKIS